MILARSSRSPGWYYRHDPETGDETNEPLENTNEKIHQTARLRLGKSNRGANDRGPFQPTSLSKYLALVEKNGKFVWVWNGWSGTREPEEAEVGETYEAKRKAKLDEEAAKNKSDAKPDTSITWFKVVSNVFAFHA